jgi:hypothetical protein
LVQQQFSGFNPNVFYLWPCRKCISFFCQKSPLSWPQTRIFPDHDAFNLKTIKARNSSKRWKGKGWASIALLKNEEKLLKHFTINSASTCWRWSQLKIWILFIHRNGDGIFLKVKLKIMKKHKLPYGKWQRKLEWKT